MGSFKTILEHQLLPVSTVALGRLITDIKDPQRRFHDPFDAGTLQSERTTQHDFQEAGIRSENLAFGARLTELLTAFRSMGTADGTSVSATASATYYLLQWDSVFKDACSLDSTRKWILEAIEDDLPVYFIVGYRTFLRPSVTESRASSRELDAVAQVPASAVIAANITPGIQMGRVLDPGVSASNTELTRGARSFRTDAEMIYAVQYCRVVLKWYSSKDLDKASLGKTRWKIHWGVRGVGDTGEDDVLDVELSGDFDGGV